jgi:hypothetical protein
MGVYVNSSGALGDVAGRDRIRPHDVNHKMTPALLFNKFLKERDKLSTYRKQRQITYSNPD